MQDHEHSALYEGLTTTEAQKHIIYYIVYIYIYACVCVLYMVSTFLVDSTT